MSAVDMSPQAVTARLRLASELSRLCLSLMQAGAKARDLEAQGGHASQTPGHASPGAKEPHGPEFS